MLIGPSSRCLTALSFCLLISVHVIATEVTLQRVPNGGIQPQGMVDSKSVLHLIYFKGEPDAGDVFYVQSKDDGVTFSDPLRVNSQPSSAIAKGTIRGARLALGKNGRVHVAWNGSNAAEPKGPKKETPMLYSRLNDAGTAFEPQRNVISTHYGLDGGGAVAADEKGNVYVFWHGQGEPGVPGEELRRAWVARSSDDGKTFAAETAAIGEKTGACGCCGMSAATDASGNVFALYRAATEKVQRGMVLISSKSGGGFSGTKLDTWQLNQCPMSSSVFYESPMGLECAWENNGQVFFTHFGSDLKPTSPVAAPGAGRGRKHPALALNAAHETLFVWTEGTGWDRGGSLAWQAYDKDGKPTAVKGTNAGIPKWSFAAAFPNSKGGFTILY